ncbi:MAG: YfcC family protein [Gemmatimonadota bacterium]|nr:YfcC family protein [Gemmatimonadota bacterium]
MRLPHPLTLLVGCVVIAAALTHVLPAGEFDRRDDPVTQRKVVVAGTYHRVDAQPVGPFGAVVAIPDGVIAGAAVITFIFLVGGAFGVVDKTGALHDGIDWLVRRLGDRGIVAIPIVCIAFAAGGAFENMQEEIIALIPALLVLTQRLGFDALTAAEMSVGAAAIGSSFSPVNPFQVLIAQKVSEVPQLSGGGYRIVFLALALLLWILGTMRHARHTRVVIVHEKGSAESHELGVRAKGVLAIVVVTFAVFVYGVAQLHWDFNQEAALFFAMGCAVGVVGGLGVSGTADAFVDGFRSMAYAALLVGFARSISVVMEQGLIIDTVVNGLASSLAGLPVAVAAVGMMLAQAAIHVPVPSVSGQAVLTMPVFAPVADLLHLSRQVAVLAYQYGAGICELITPTNGALMAILAAAGIRYDEWIRGAWKTIAVVALTGAGAVVLAVAMGVR